MSFISPIFCVIINILTALKETELAITRLTKHDHHKVRIHLTKETSKHYAALRCVNCNTHIQWLSRPQADYLIEQGIDKVTPWTSKEELAV
jgi:hypothetical protein